MEKLTRRAVVIGMAAATVAAAVPVAAIAASAPVRPEQMSNAEIIARIDYLFERMTLPEKLEVLAILDRRSSRKAVA